MLAQTPRFNAVKGFRAVTTGCVLRVAPTVPCAALTKKLHVKKISDVTAELAVHAG